ncbi:TonB-dependent receptor [Novosphingobium sp. AP12]|uniref:TonB-dependent receptor n=1 Tax=Novosphingobium sp. AP12 TaxID=1144305 RepID=UPI000271EC1C|nr:TonB-dependent receptor [Novosphingobium sp. AP12]EJL34337.1 TonB-dependent receptor [Novosphingobium sp. AP12]
MNFRVKSRILLASTAIGLSFVQPVFAQDAGIPASDGASQDDETAPAADIVVTGVRASLQSAQSIKQNSPQIVDSIVAEDIGKLPDRNIAEALQRIPGIQVQRTYGEGSSVAIRGLTQVRTELNGRDIFTASGTNQLSLEDIPSELLGGIDVYKNPSADLTEDQLSGTINFRTRKPFDFKGLKVAGSVTNSYFELAGKSRPSASLLLSDRWDTGIGEIGILASVSFQKTTFRQDRTSTEPFYTLDDSIGSDGNPVNATDYATAQALGRVGQVTTLPHGAGIGKVYGDRRRLGTDVSVQWRPTDTLELTAEVFRNDYKFGFYDYIFFASAGADSIAPTPGAPFTYGANGDFESGTFSNVPIGDYTSFGSRHSRTTDYSLNAKWHPTDRLTVTGDLQHVKSTSKAFRSIVGLSGTVDTFYENIGGRSTPEIAITTPNGLTDPALYTSGFYLDNLNESVGKDTTARIDAEYAFDGGFLKSVKVGGRFANRKNSAIDTGYRYTGLASIPDLAVVDQSDFFYGKSDTFGDFLAFPLDTIQNYDRTREVLGIDGTPQYLPSGANSIGLKTYAGYAAAFFGTQGGLPIDGNIGLRVVHTQQDVSGFYQQTSLVDLPNGTQISGPTAFNPISAGQNYTSFLPSINVRLKLTDTLQVRLAASKNIARPNFNQLNPSLTIIQPGREQEDELHNVSGGNPELKPMKSKNFDASIEWYFSRTGSVSLAGFYKRISNYIQTGIADRDITFDNGRTFTYSVTSYDNVATAKVKGFEAAYQQFFDFLPGPLSGLGMQANFTYVDSQAPSPAISGPSISVPLELLSKYNYNLVGMYEKGPFSLRVAYNWRSKYVETTSGNGSGNLPIFNKPFGQLDASMTYNVTPNFAFTIDAVNLTNTMRSTYFGLTSRPREQLYVDRRISGTARITF